MNIGVYIETGGINTLAISDSIIDQLASLDQAESQSRRENIKFGIHHRMRSGKTLINHTQFLGYTKGLDGVLQIVPEEAEIVRMIFDLYVHGNSVRKIQKYLESHGLKTVTGKSEWSISTIDRMLSNEKYVGQVLMQKTYVPDFLTGKKKRTEDSWRCTWWRMLMNQSLTRKLLTGHKRWKGALNTQYKWSRYCDIIISYSLKWD